MRLLIQRVSHASVLIDNNEKRSIGTGLLISIGISEDALQDTQTKIEKSVKRIINLAFFENKEGRIKKSLQDIQGEILIISNFTLHAKNKKGNQLDFGYSASSHQAKPVYDSFIEELVKRYDKTKIQTGEFGSFMEVESTVSGPVNVLLDI